MTEGAQYLAAIGYEPFADDDRFVRGLTEVWYSVIYGAPRPPRNHRRERQARCQVTQV